MAIQKRIFKSIWQSLEGQCTRLIDLSHLEQSAESLRMVASVPVKSYLNTVYLKGWIYKKASGFKSWFSRSKIT